MTNSDQVKMNCDKLPFFKNFIPGKIYWIDTDKYHHDDIVNYVNNLVKMPSDQQHYFIKYSDEKIIELISSLHSGHFHALTSSKIFEDLYYKIITKYPGCDSKFLKPLISNYANKDTREEKKKINKAILPLAIITNNKKKWLNCHGSSIYLYTQNEYLNRFRSDNNDNISEFNTVIVDEDKNNARNEIVVNSKDFNRVLFIYSRSKICNNKALTLRYKKLYNSISVLNIIKVFHIFFTVIQPNYDYYGVNFSISLLNSDI